ncbi:Hsp70 family protein [Parabacteroides segnis]|uniref:Hsp70 family protein n=1 Tax=Parabacteroides segnis TaxID=2763058 RepID=UPI0035185F07
MSRIIGIDLGTSNSVVSLYENGKVKILPLQGQTTTPSVLLFDGGKVEVGYNAKNRMAIVPKKILKSTKRDLGQDVTYNIESQQITPMMAASLILKKLKQMAEEELNDTVNDVVITIPAYFGFKERNETEQAAINAGLKPIALLDEPTAAAICYAQNRNREQTFVVVDLGGGTFDVTVLHYYKEGDIFIYDPEVKDGDHYLGGDDFDNCIVDWLINEEGATGFKDKLELNIVAEKAKIDLASADVADIDCPFVKTTLTRGQYQKMIQPYLDKICKTIKNTVAASGRSLDDIDRYILVGGSCKHPIVKKAVIDCVGKEPYISSNPDTVVAEGAALYHHMCMLVEFNRPDGGTVIVRSPKTLGTDIKTDEGLINAVLIKEGDVLPVGVANIATLEDGQTKLISRVCEGDKREFVGNKEIGSVDIDLKYPGDHFVVTVFNLNISGSLNFETYEIENDESLIDDIIALWESKNESLVVNWNLWRRFNEQHKSHIQWTPFSLKIK